jgi:hypothetical protein
LNGRMKMASRLCQRLRESSVLVQLAPSYVYSRKQAMRGTVSDSEPAETLIRGRGLDPAFGGEAGREGAESYRVYGTTRLAALGRGPVCKLTRGRRAGAVAPGRAEPRLRVRARGGRASGRCRCVDHAVPGQARPGQARPRTVTSRPRPRGHGDRNLKMQLPLAALAVPRHLRASLAACQ